MEALKAGELRALPEAPGPLPLAALWWAARGEWERAHEAAQADAGREAAWVHAYLHRVEGDEENAAYWYGRAGRPVARGGLDEEGGEIAEALAAEGA